MFPLQRLMGLETEYAVRFRSARADGERPTDYALFNRLLRSLRDFLPTADSVLEKPGRFLATGGAIRFESPWQAAESGLVEGATPECRSPHELLVWQQAQDRLLAKAARSAGQPDGEFVLIKNNCDSDGRTYGSHENYDASFASGPRLWMWRAGVVALFPLLMVALLLLVVVLIPVFLLFILSMWITWALVKRWNAWRGKQAPKLTSFLGEGFFSDDEYDAPWPLWFEPVIIGISLLILVPVIVPFWLLVYGVAFRQQRRRLLPFLITRTIFAGSGWLDKRGTYHLAQKAAHINCTIGWYGLFDRPIFNLGNLFKTYILMPLWPRRFPRLFDRRQRLQICHGDSNMCEESEYLRVATTCLVLDAIESGALRDVPQVWFPVRTLRRIASDVSLRETVTSYQGRALTALDVQRFYFEACREFVCKQPNRSEEADKVLQRWEDVLDRLAQDRNSLVGRIDWITKRYLLKHAGADLSLEARRKIDLCYHEISANGYYEKLQQSSLVQRLTTDEEVERAMRNAPTTTPAGIRGRYIREFADGDTPLIVDWQRIQLGEGRKRTTIETNDRRKDPNQGDNSAPRTK